VGILKDWLVRAVATTLHEGSDTLTLARIHEHALSEAQCERMAIEATEASRPSALRTNTVTIYGACYSWGWCPLLRLPLGLYPPPELTSTLPGATPGSTTRRKHTTKPPSRACPTQPRPRKKTVMPAGAHARAREDTRATALGVFNHNVAETAIL
jgi:hypothetical protein